MPQWSFFGNVGLNRPRVQYEDGVEPLTFEEFHILINYFQQFSNQNRTEIPIFVTHLIKIVGTVY